MVEYLIVVEVELKIVHDILQVWGDRAIYYTMILYYMYSNFHCNTCMSQKFLECNTVIKQ